MCFGDFGVCLGLSDSVVILTSFRAEKGSYVSTFFPQSFTLDNYTKLFTDTTILNFPRMFTNTLFIAVCSCIIATF